MWIPKIRNVRAPAIVKTRKSSTGWSKTRDPKTEMKAS